MRLLLIEDRPLIAQNYLENLPRESVAVDVVTSRDPGLLHTAETSAADVILVSLPFLQGDALALVRDLRRAGKTAGIMVAQEVPNTDEALAFFEAGADDLFVRPMNARHLAARMRAIVRRQNGHIRPEIVVGELTYFFDGRAPTVNGKPLSLSRRERSLLECLVLRQGRTVSRDFIFANLYGSYNADVDPKIIDVYICKLRKKLREASANDTNYISTIFGTGYMLGEARGGDEAAEADAAPARSRKAA